MIIYQVPETTISSEAESDDISPAYAFVPLPYERLAQRTVSKQVFKRWIGARCLGLVSDNQMEGADAYGLLENLTQVDSVISRTSALAFEDAARGGRYKMPERDRLFSSALSMFSLTQLLQEFPAFGHMRSNKGEEIWVAQNGLELIHPALEPRAPIGSRYLQRKVNPYDIGLVKRLKREVSTSRIPPIIHGYQITQDPDRSFVVRGQFVAAESTYHESGFVKIAEFSF